MGLLNWMKPKDKKEQDVTLTKVKEQTVDMGEMASGNPVAADAAVVRMMAQKNSCPKILVVQDGDYMPEVTDYALRMAHRLDCEIVALDITDTPLQFTGERKERESKRFLDKAGQANANFARQAKDKGIVMHHIMEIADPMAMVAKLSADDAGIRYVLTKPEQSSLQPDAERVHVPVFDLHCSRISR